MCDFLSPALTASGCLGLFLSLQAGTRLAVSLNGSFPFDCGFLLERGDGRLHLIHASADFVDLSELLGREQAVRDHRAVNQGCPQVIGRRDQVATPKPRIA